MTSRKGGKEVKVKKSKERRKVKCGVKKRDRIKGRAREKKIEKNEDKRMGERERETISRERKGNKRKEK